MRRRKRRQRRIPVERDSVGRYANRPKNAPRIVSRNGLQTSSKASFADLSSLRGEGLPRSRPTDDAPVLALTTNLRAIPRRNTSVLTLRPDAGTWAPLVRSISKHRPTSGNTHANLLGGEVRTAERNNAFVTYRTYRGRRRGVNDRPLAGSTYKKCERLERSSTKKASSAQDL